MFKISLEEWTGQWTTPLKRGGLSVHCCLLLSVDMSTIPNLYVRGVDNEWTL